MGFRVKLMLLMTLLLAVVFGIGGALFITASFRTTLSKDRQNALYSYETVRGALSALNSAEIRVDSGVIAELLTRLDRPGTTQWDVLRLSNGEQTIYAKGETARLRTDLPRPQPDQFAYVVDADDTGHFIQMDSTLTIREEPYALTARYALEEPYRARDNLMRLFLRIYAVAVLAGFVLAFFASTALTRPLRKLSATARRIADGDLSQRSNLRTNDEIGMLSRNFDRMASRLTANIRHLEQETERQESFMGAFAHELKTPMTSIIGYADLLRQNGLSDADRMTAANYIFTEAERLEKLSYKLLELLLLQKDRFTPTTVRLRTLFTDTGRAMAPLLESRGVRLRCRCGGGTVSIEADLVRSLLYNLLDNAAKACDGVDPARAEIVLTGTVLRDGCIVTVEDRGRGMEQKELARITEAFYRVDKARSRKQGGAGLGLALCRQIVLLHDGEIRFASAPGKGTRVTVRLRNLREEAPIA